MRAETVTHPLRFRLLDAARPDQRSVWLELWHGWRHREVMAHPEYARLFTRPCDRAVCVVGEHRDGGAVLFPLVLRPLAEEAWATIGEQRWDASTPYGYGGPFAIGRALADPSVYWREYAAWCRDERLVSTFVRLSLFPDELAPLPWPTEVRLPNVVVSLRGGMDVVWANYEGKVRKWIRKAEAAGLEVEIDPNGNRLDAFLDVYTRTMERRGAASWYFFSRRFFERLFEQLAGHCVLFHVLARGEVVSSDLVLCSEERVYYFLGGTLASHFPLGPNYLLKHRIAQWASAEGKKEYVLGGGYEPGDGLFRYKRAYAWNGQVPFRIAAITHDVRAYSELVRDRAAFETGHQRTWVPRPGFFPAYRG